jgi:hypothetical protein
LLAAAWLIHPGFQACVPSFWRSHTFRPASNCAYIDSAVSVNVFRRLRIFPAFSSSTVRNSLTALFAARFAIRHHFKHRLHPWHLAERPETVLSKGGKLKIMHSKFHLFSIIFGREKKYGAELIDWPSYLVGWKSVVK